MRAIVVAIIAGGVLLAACGGPGAAGTPAPPGPSSPAGRGTAAAGPAAGPASPPQADSGAGGCSPSPVRQALTGLEPGGLTGVQFVSASQGWVVGTGQILSTADGGARWTVQDRGALDLTSLDFVSGLRGWAAGADTLLTTSDGGRHWTALPESCPLIRAVHFVSGSAGFAIAGGTAVSLYGGAAPQTGGVVLATSDGGQSWHRLAAPAGAQSVCFNDRRSGWLGADGRLYRTADGGRHWTLAAPGVTPQRPADPPTMVVQCAGAGSAWALDIGPGAAASQMPHVGYHAGPAGAAPIFAEQYFPHPGANVSAPSPSAYPGALSALSASAAVYVDWCPACGYGTGPWDLATGNGAALAREGNVGDLNEPEAASFLTPSLGWVVGSAIDSRDPARPHGYWRVVATSDAGRAWRVDYSQRS
jgi:hypothetical protein